MGRTLGCLLYILYMNLRLIQKKHSSFIRTYPKSKRCKYEIFPITSSYNLNLILFIAKLLHLQPQTSPHILHCIFFV